jgi:hypothetical protein
MRKRLYLRSRATKSACPPVLSVVCLSFTPVVLWTLSSLPPPRYDLTSKVRFTNNNKVEPLKK